MESLYDEDMKVSWRFTDWSVLLPSSVARRSAKWPKEWDGRYLQWKWPFPQSKGEELNHSEEAQIWPTTHIERRQLRWLRVRMTLRSLPGEMFLRPGSRPKSHWKDYIFQLAWEQLGERLDELEEVARGWLLTLLWMDLISDITEVLISVSWKPSSPDEKRWYVHVAGLPLCPL